MGCRELEKKNGVKEMGEREKRSWNAVSHHTHPSFEYLDLSDVANSYYQSKQYNGKGNEHVPFESTQLHKAHACPSSCPLQAVFRFLKLAVTNDLNAIKTEQAFYRAQIDRVKVTCPTVGENKTGGGGKGGGETGWGGGRAGRSVCLSHRKWHTSCLPFSTARV